MANQQVSIPPSVEDLQYMRRNLFKASIALLFLLAAFFGYSAIAGLSWPVSAATFIFCCLLLNYLYQSAYPDVKFKPLWKVALKLVAPKRRVWNNSS